MFLADHVPERILHRAPLRAIVMPRVTETSQPRLEPLSAADDASRACPDVDVPAAGRDG